MSFITNNTSGLALAFRGKGAVSCVCQCGTKEPDVILTFVSAMGWPWCICCLLHALGERTCHWHLVVPQAQQCGPAGALRSPAVARELRLHS